MGVPQKKGVFGSAAWRNPNMKRILSVVPESIKRPLQRLRDRVRALQPKRRFCPVCSKSSRRFRPFGAKLREDAQCDCGALERHRFLWLYLTKKTDLFDGNPKKMLHVAPEYFFESILKERLGESYITADLSDSRAMVKMDIISIQYPDESFDVIYCSHVLEHVQDDRLAMREFYRVLKKNGWAILLVPISAEVTFEDPSIVEPQERVKAFGKEDHVRRYGPDYVDRLLEAGFKVEVKKVDDLFEKGDTVRMGLTPASGEIYYCTK